MLSVPTNLGKPPLMKVQPLCMYVQFQISDSKESRIPLVPSLISKEHVNDI